MPITGNGNMLKCYTKGNALCKVETNQRQYGQEHLKRSFAIFRDLTDYYWSAQDLEELIELMVQTRAALVAQDAAHNVTESPVFINPQPEGMDNYDEDRRDDSQF